jgi:glucokinase
MGALKKGHPSIITEFMRDDKAISSKMIKKTLEHRDELVTNIMIEASDYLSNGLATIMNFYNPELIVMGGGLIDAIDEFYERTVKKAKVKALPIPASKTQFKKAQLGDFSGVVGACFLDNVNKDLKKKLNA